MCHISDGQVDLPEPRLRAVNAGRSVVYLFTGNGARRGKPREYRPGDAIFFGFGIGDGSADHVVSGNRHRRSRVYTVEGNHARKRSYPLIGLASRAMV